MKPEFTDEELELINDAMDVAWRIYPQGCETVANKIGLYFKQKNCPHPVDKRKMLPLGTECGLCGERF